MAVPKLLLHERPPCYRCHGSSCWRCRPIRRLLIVGDEVRDERREHFERTQHVLAREIVRLRALADAGDEGAELLADVLLTARMRARVAYQVAEGGLGDG